MSDQENTEIDFDRQRADLSAHKPAEFVRLDDWEPPRQGIFAHIRIGKRWFNVLWLVPIAAVLLVIGVAAAREMRSFPEVIQFIARYPGQSSAPVDYSGFPLWIRLQHLFNLVLMIFIIRSGIQILADHPRLYWNRDCTPGTEWFRFQHAVPTGKIWTAKDDAVTIPDWLGLPGLRHSIGLARWWHFGCDGLWLVNGLIFYIFLFSTHQWQRLIPTSWDFIPNAISTALQYLSLQFPEEKGWLRYNSLQQFAYFVTVFVAAPAAVFTGLMQGPAIANRFGFLAKIFNRQVCRSIHFLILLWFIQFIGVHVTMVFITGVRRNLNHIALGIDTTEWGGLAIFSVALVVIFMLWFSVSPFTLKHARLVQKVGRFLTGGVKGWLEYMDPETQYSEKDISPFMWPNGIPPNSEEYMAICADNFAKYNLNVGGLVEQPRTFTYAELLAMPRQDQITAHYCIQGWSGVAKWTGVTMQHIMDLVKPTAEAKFAVFYSFGEGGHGGIYYDAHKIENMKHKLTILAYEMNGQPLPVMYGAPLRLRCENELGFKMVKWIRSIEFVSDFSKLGAGQGGYNEDHEFYGYQMPI